MKVTTHQQEIAAPDKTEVRSQKGIVFGTTRWLTYAAVFTALAVVMKFVGQFLTLTDSFKITLIYFTWLLGGAVLGPVGGGMVCFASDVIGAIAFPQGSINPLLILGNTVYGILGAVIFRYVPIRNNYVKLTLSGIVCTIVCTCGINTLALYYSYRYFETLTFWQYFAGYRALQPVVAVINIGVALALVPVLHKLRMLPAHKKRTTQNAEARAQAPAQESAQ